MKTKWLSKIKQINLSYCPTYNECSLLFLHNKMETCKMHLYSLILYMYAPYVYKKSVFNLVKYILLITLAYWSIVKEFPKTSTSCFTDYAKVFDCVDQNKLCMLVTQSCPTLWEPMDRSPPKSSVMEFSMQVYWSVLPLSVPGGLPNPGIKLPSLASPALVGGVFNTVLPGKPTTNCGKYLKRWEYQTILFASWKTYSRSRCNS